MRPALRAEAGLATFTVDYIGFTPQAQAAFQYAVSLWTSQITSSVPIHIRAEFTALSEGFLGFAGPTWVVRDFPGAVLPNTFYPIALANKLSGMDLVTAGSDPQDIDAAFSNTFAFYFGTDGNAPPGTYDFVSVVLHELGHGLGFIPSMDYGFYAPGVGDWGLGTGFPFIYDRFLINGSSQSLLNTTLFPNPSLALGNQLISNNIYFNGPNARAANGGALAPRIYAPNPWEPGSSISHLDEMTYGVGNPNSLMTPFLMSAEAIHDPGPVTRGIFWDEGWTVDPCSFSLSQTSASFGVEGGSASVFVTAGTGCSWTATSNAAWITITSGSSGSGNGVVDYSVAPNASVTPRSGTMRIARQIFKVNQAGCTYTLNPMAAAYAASGGTGSISITAGSVCGWTVSGVPAWASLTTAGSGAGNGTVGYSVAVNGTGTSRTATLGVGNSSFVLTQVSTSLTNVLVGQPKRFTLDDIVTELYFTLLGRDSRSYCVNVVPAPTEVNQSDMVNDLKRANLQSIDLFSSQKCFKSIGNDPVLMWMRDIPSGSRSYRLTVTETTLWANWFFIGSDYSSYTLLRNTTSDPIDFTIVWRDTSGAIVGSHSGTLWQNRIEFIDARSKVTGAFAGSVEVIHNGPPQGIVGSQTTLSATTGLSFDTLLFQRKPW